MIFMTSKELAIHHRDMVKNLERLNQASDRWTKADRKRGEATRRNLQQEIGRIEGDLHMAGAWPKSA